MSYQVRDLPTVTVRDGDLRRSVETALVDHVERRMSARPVCQCGRHTTVVSRDGSLRLTCSALVEPGRATRVGRIMALASAAFHVDEYLADDLAADLDATLDATPAATPDATPDATLGSALDEGTAPEASGDRRVPVARPAGDSRAAARPALA